MGVSPGYVGKIERRLLPGIIAYLTNADVMNTATEVLDLLDIITR